jgi:hypothetical protein
MSGTEPVFRIPVMFPAGAARADIDGRRSDKVLASRKT